MGQHRTAEQKRAERDRLEKVRRLERERYGDLDRLERERPRWYTPPNQELTEADGGG